MIKFLLSTKLGELRWTQADLARKTGIRPSTINDWYHGFAERIGLEHLDAICGVLDCDVSDIIVRVPPKEEAQRHGIAKRLNVLRQIARPFGLGIAKRGNRFMVFRIVDSFIVFGDDPAPWSQDLAAVERFLADLKQRLARGDMLPCKTD